MQLPLAAAVVASAPKVVQAYDWPWRFSTEPEDPGYKAWLDIVYERGVNIRTWLDGVEQNPNHLIMCDAKLGCIKRAVVDEQGDFVVVYATPGVQCRVEKYVSNYEERMFARSKGEVPPAPVIEHKWIVEGAPNEYGKTFILDEVKWGKVEIKVEKLLEEHVYDRP